MNLDPQVGFGVGANIHLVASDGTDDRELLTVGGPTTARSSPPTGSGSTSTLNASPPGKGHPADLVLRLMLVEDDDWRGARCLAELPGGQGTLNVNSWEPDSRRLAWVSYPFD